MLKWITNWATPLKKLWKLTEQNFKQTAICKKIEKNTSLQKKYAYPNISLQYLECGENFHQAEQKTF